LAGEQLHDRLNRTISFWERPPFCLALLFGFVSRPLPSLWTIWFPAFAAGYGNITPTPLRLRARRSAELSGLRENAGELLDSQRAKIETEESRRWPRGELHFSTIYGITWRR